MKLRIDPGLLHGFDSRLHDPPVGDAVRSALNVKKVTSSHAKGETVILSDEPLDEGKLRETISATGYQVGGINSVTYEKKCLFSFLHK